MKETRTLPVHAANLVAKVTVPYTGFRVLELWSCVSDIAVGCSNRLL